jgi:hypothetical protein
MRLLTVLSALGLTLTVVLLLGCGGIRRAQQRAIAQQQEAMAQQQQAFAEQERMDLLKQVGLAYHSYLDRPENKGKAPKTAADLQPYLPLAIGAPARTVLTDGSVVFMYGVRAPEDMPLGPANYVLAYDATVPAQGGVVLFGDGSVRTVTAAEFLALTLATPARGKDDKKGDKKGDKK